MLQKCFRNASEMLQHHLTSAIYLHIRPASTPATPAPLPQTVFKIKRSRLKIQKNAFSRIGAKLWNGIECSLKELPKASFKKKKNQSILLSIFYEEDSFIDINKIISKVKSSATKTYYKSVFGHFSPLCAVFIFNVYVK